MAEPIFTVTVLYGRELERAYAMRAQPELTAREVASLVVKHNGSIYEREYRTEAEMKAFIDGVRATEGKEGYSIYRAEQTS